MYGRFMDKNFRENTFSHYTGLLSYNNEYIYRRCYFRTKPSQPFCVRWACKPQANSVALRTSIRKAP